MHSLEYKNDQELVQALIGDEESRRSALAYFFKNPKIWQWTQRYVALNGGSPQDAKDVFEESFLVFERNIRTGNFRGESSLQTWFHGIVRWQLHVLKRKRKPSIDLKYVDAPTEEQNPEKLYISEERRVILERLLVQVGERCQKLLGYFQLSYSMTEIKNLMGFSSEQVAANESYSCREKLKKVIQQQPEIVHALKRRFEA